MTPAIVVLAYERPDALRRLLSSLDAALYPPSEDVTLVISLDRSERPGGTETRTVAREFEWRHGAKDVIERTEHLGVVRHFHEAGGLTRTYGDVILLEDDLTVGPPFYAFASAVLTAYGPDARVAGCCLYGLWFNGFTLAPFTPIDDGGDVFFLGVPYTQGLCFSAGQWAAYDAWRQEGRVESHRDLHPAFLNFGPEEWFPSLASYLAQTGRFFCFPRVSLTIGWGDAGAHFDRKTAWFQTPIQLVARPYRLPALNEATAVYDGFFELLPDRLKRLAPSLQAFDFDLDLNATKEPANLRHEHVLTTRQARGPDLRFGLEMEPPELNVITGMPGEVISLARRENVRWDAAAGAQARQRMQAYAWRRYQPGVRGTLRLAAARTAEALRSRTRGSR